MTGGYLCSSRNPRDRYTIGKELGRGEEGVIYSDYDNPKIAIKKYIPIVAANPSYKQIIKEYQRVFRISKRIGDIGIGPKVYYYKICKQLITINLTNDFVRGRTAAIFPFGSKEVKIIKDPKVTEFSYEAYVPYMVMESLEGCHQITAEELDNPVYMNEVYESYLELYSKGIFLSDIHTGNIVVHPRIIYFIDFGQAYTFSSKRMPKVLSIEKLKEIILKPENAEYYRPSPLSETSIDSQVSQVYSL